MQAIFSQEYPAYCKEKWCRTAEKGPLFGRVDGFQIDPNAITKKERLNMIEQDTIRLLRECDAGVKMGISSIDDVLEDVRSHDFQTHLRRCRDEHDTLQTEIQDQLGKFHDEGKNPNPIAKGMSWVKTNVKLSIDNSDAVIADLMTDGCDMGVKSLSKYLNQYKAADETSKDIAKRLIKLESQLASDIRPYL